MNPYYTETVEACDEEFDREVEAFIEQCARALEEQ